MLAIVAGIVTISINHAMDHLLAHPDQHGGVGPERNHGEGVPGELRAARESDIPLLDTWARAYLEETGTEAPPRFPLQQWVSRGDMRVWDVDGEPVAMTHASRPHGGVSRISWVYAPPEQRGHAYAAATVAAVSALQRRAGHRCLLYTDLDSPASSRLYQRVGYRRVGDSCVLALTQVR